MTFINCNFASFFFNFCNFSFVCEKNKNRERTALNRQQTTMTPFKVLVHGLFSTESDSDDQRTMIYNLCSTRKRIVPQDKKIFIRLKIHSLLFLIFLQHIKKGNSSPPKV